VTCEDCREQLAEERAFQEAVGSMPAGRGPTWTVPASLLAQCRSELYEKLDDLATPPVKEWAPAFLWLATMDGVAPGMERRAVWLAFPGLWLAWQVERSGSPAGMTANARWTRR